MKRILKILIILIVPILAQSCIDLSLNTNGKHANVGVHLKTPNGTISTNNYINLY